MVYGDLQFFDIIIFAGIAAFLIFRLRNVLGKRTGHEKSISEEQSQQSNKDTNIKKVPQLKENEQKFEKIYSEVDQFDHKTFLDGAKKAFEIIITSFNNGDKKTLKPLVSKNVYDAFESAIDKKLNNPNSQFYSLVVDGVQDANISQEKITISVNFISEQIINNDEGSIIKKKDTWTFEKHISSKSPIWILSAT
ncbi:MAG: hypothetical protein CMI96_00715 [Pelagibacteraceae bacterium]|nr:hypothetical protein [Pelagibacteraceae bacterium]|tara:strand:- start:43600 stop:44181 length:582 start_codon:yes stop_codon:yes gene_type:complete